MKNLTEVVKYTLLFFYMFFLMLISSHLKDINESIKALNISIHQPITTINQQDMKAVEMRITGYVPTSEKTALMEEVVTGWTAAVSRDCIEFLGSDVYVLGHGVFRVNDLTNARLDEEFGMCTLDIAVPTKEDAYKIGNNTSTVVRINW